MLQLFTYYAQERWFVLSMWRDTGILNLERPGQISLPNGFSSLYTPTRSVTLHPHRLDIISINHFLSVIKNTLIYIFLVTNDVGHLFMSLLAIYFYSFYGFFHIFYWVVYLWVYTITLYRFCIFMTHYILGKCSSIIYFACVLFIICFILIHSTNIYWKYPLLQWAKPIFWYRSLISTQICQHFALLLLFFIFSLGSPIP